MSHQHINQTSNNTELYTPNELVLAARKMLGTIDLDPASSIKANKIVQANKIYTKKSNGLKHHWFGKVWMNHPCGSYEKVCKTQTCKKQSCKKRGYHLSEDFPGNDVWIKKLHESYINN